MRWEGKFGKFFNLAFSSFGRVTAINDSELRLASDDGKSELVVPLDTNLQFGYADSRDAPPEEKQYGDCILIFFTPPDEDEPDFITLGAIG